MLKKPAMNVDVVDKVKNMERENEELKAQMQFFLESHMQLKEQLISNKTIDDNNNAYTDKEMEATFPDLKERVKRRENEQESNLNKLLND